MNVVSNVKGVVAGIGLKGGNVEFWPNNYSQVNTKKIPGASNNTFDFGDNLKEPVDGYGSMQVHNHAARQTVFAFNNWKSGISADLGIGNHPGKNQDWTFSKTASSYSHKRLAVLVRLKQ